MEFWKMNGAGNEGWLGGGVFYSYSFKEQTFNCDIALTESDHILLKEHSMPGKSDKNTLVSLK